MPVTPDDPRLQRCAYAKLYGDGGKVDVLVRKFQVLLGRPSKGKEVDVPLADHKAVSREHAYIRYNFDTSERAGRAVCSAPCNFRGCCLGCCTSAVLS